MKKRWPKRCLTLPNILTASRIAAAPVLAIVVLKGGAAWIAVTIVALAALTDVADGPLARAMNQVSELGAILDPIADKILITTALLLLCAEGTIRNATLLPVFIILWRELFVCGLREYGRLKGLTIPVSKLARLKTALQFLSAILFFAAREPSPASASLLGTATFLLWAAAAVTLYTGLDYFQQARQQLWK
jgi:cardiolipin synthase